MSIVNVKYLISYIFGLLTDHLVFKMSLDITLDHQHIRPKLMCALFPNKFEKKTKNKKQLWNTQGSRNFDQTVKLD